MPAGITKLFRSAFDWNLYTKHMRGVGDREVYLARGRLLGGSSCTNATLYHRGSAADYDSWGVRGWGSQDVLPYFRSSESNSRGASETHGAAGPLKVEDPRYKNALHDVFFRTAESHGLRLNSDFNDWSHDQEGYGTFQVTQDKGQRADAARQYLQPALGRPNLKVVTSCQVTRVALEGSGSGSPRAAGVEFVTPLLSARTRHQASLAPAGEVLMCAGAVHSPFLLMHSGIGDAVVLSDLGIKPVHSLPAVGRHLQDHPATLSTFESTRPGDSITDHIYGSKGSIRKRAVLSWALFKQGPLTSTGCDRGAFVRTRKGLSQPDLQIRFVPGMVRATGCPPRVPCTRV